MVKQCLSSKYITKCGACEGFLNGDSGELILQGALTGIFISKTYDSGEKGMEWNKVVMDIDRNAVISVYVWIFDKAKEGETADAIENAAEKLRYIKERANYVSDYREMLLYGNGKGRFAKLAVELTLEDEQKPAALRGYAVSFPKESFTSYLPSYYQGNMQLERFLAVHQSIYLDLEQKIDSLAESLDYERCGRRQAVRLAEWMGWGELAGQLDYETLKKLLKTGTFLISRKGTGEYYVMLIKILLNRDAVLIEDSERQHALMLIKEKPDEKGKKYLDWIKRNTPIGIDIDFVVIHKTYRLSDQYFLDKTAYVSQYEQELGSGGVMIEDIRLL